MSDVTFRQSAASKSRPSRTRYIVPSFLQGMGSVLDIFGVLDTNIQWRPRGANVDAKALSSDFRVVATDLARAVSRYESEKETHLPTATDTA